MLAARDGRAGLWEALLKADLIHFLENCVSRREVILGVPRVTRRTSMSNRAFEVLDSSWTWRMTVCLIALESMVGGSCGLRLARRAKDTRCGCWRGCRRRSMMAFGLPRKPNRAVAVPAPCTFRLRLTLGRIHPLVSNSAAGGIALQPGQAYWAAVRRGSERQAADPGPQIRVAHAAEKEAS